MAKATTESGLKTAWIKKGKAKYTTGITAIGVDTYFDCGTNGGMDTAVCLRMAKKTAGTVKAWADAWETAMEND